jgi:hypothetical protein
MTNLSRDTVEGKLPLRHRLLTCIYIYTLFINQENNSTNSFHCARAVQKLAQSDVIKAYPAGCLPAHEPIHFIHRKSLNSHDCSCVAHSDIVESDWID